jgi:hypothetical protein
MFNMQHQATCVADDDEVRCATFAFSQLAGKNTGDSLAESHEMKVSCTKPALDR